MLSHTHTTAKLLLGKSTIQKHEDSDPTMECSADVSWTGTIFNPSEHVFDSSNEPYSFTPHVPWSGCCS